MGSIYQSIELLSKEKGIESQILFDAVKDAMLVAARKQFKVKPEERLEAEFDAKGGLQIYVAKRVVDTVEDPHNDLTLEQARKMDSGVEVGGEVRRYLPTDVLGRIAAQTAKQVILQKVREAERDTVQRAFTGREGELVQCTVKRIEALDLLVEIDREKIEARLPKREQSRLDSFQINDRVKCVIKGVERSGKSSGVVVSRAAPELVMRLFEQEVPEIYDNTVVIKACAREAGERTKIAVFSRDRDVDPVGACVGMKGMRVQSIIRELRNEKIDIIEYAEDPVKFVTHALSPAKITRVAVLDAEDKHMEVIVDDTQLSLAIGKKGQNVRLAAKLLGWKIDIKSEEEKRQEVESQMASFALSGTPIAVLGDHGLADEVIDALLQNGLSTVEKLGAMSAEQLDALPGLEGRVDLLVAAINSYYGPYVEEGAASPEPAEAMADPAEAVAEATDGEAALPDASAAAEVEGEAVAVSAEAPSVESESVTIPSGEADAESGLTEENTR